MKTHIVIWLVGTLMILSSLSHAQESGPVTTEYPMPVIIRNPAEIRSKHASFTFVRIRYSADARSPWATDYPDAELNFTARFQEVTGLPGNPDSMVLELTDPKLPQQPFIYIVEGGHMRPTPEEVNGLRAYLLGGGFLMVDDFWGEAEWSALAAQFRRVFPDREPVDLPLEHPLFRCFYDIRTKPQVPAINVALMYQSTGRTWEHPDAKEAHYRGLFDDDGRLMVIFCHNTDLGDGWERGGANEYYYREFSLKRAFPMGINIVVYALTQ